MPTYQYACTACAERLEVVQRFTDEPLTECPVCGGALRKVFSPVGVVFKGSGFYKTDSRRTSSSSSSSTAAPAPAASADAPAATPSEPAKPAGDAKPAPSSTGSTPPSAAAAS